MRRYVTYLEGTEAVVTVRLLVYSCSHCAVVGVHLQSVTVTGWVLIVTQKSHVIGRLGSVRVYLMLSARTAASAPPTTGSSPAEWDVKHVIATTRVALVLSVMSLMGSASVWRGAVGVAAINAWLYTTEIRQRSVLVSADRIIKHTLMCICTRIRICTRTHISICNFSACNKFPLPLIL